MTSHPKPHCHLFIVLCLFLLPISSNGAETFSISGTVIDPAGNPVPDATLSLYRDTGVVQRTRTRLDGGFAFAPLQRGTYALECFKEGFQKLSRRIVLHDTFPTLRLPLELAGLHQDVVVIASQLPELPSETSKAVSVISRDELERRDVTGLTDALHQIPSLQIQQLGGPGALASYRFRGLRSEDTAILWDGFRLRDVTSDKSSASPFLSDLLVTDAERIEVLYGAGSALYGTNSVGGTINVIPQEPLRPLGGSLSFQGGSLGLLQGNGGFSGYTADRRFAYTVHADHVNYTRGADEHDTYRNNGGTARATYQLNAQARLTLRFGFTDSFLFLNESPFPAPGLPALPPGQFVRQAIPFPQPGATFYSQLDDPDNHQRNRLLSGAARLDHEVNEKWTYALGYQSLRTRRRFDEGPGTSPQAQQFGLLEFPGTDRYQGALEELFWRSSFVPSPINSTHGSLYFERDSLDQTVFGLRTEAVQRSLALHLVNQTRLLEGRFQFQAAFQAQWYGLDPPRFNDATNNPYGSVANLDIPATYNGDASLAYFLTKLGTKLRLHVGNGYRSPSLFERFGGGGLSAFRSYFGNPELHPERSTFLDGGFDQLLLRDYLRVSGTYFYSHLQTIIVDPFSPINPTLRYLNLKGGNARGLELSVSFRPASNLDFSGSYTYVNFDQPSPTLAGETRALGLANHQATFQMNLRPSRKMHWNLRVLAVSDHDFPVFSPTTFRSEAYRFGGYARLDWTGTYILSQSGKSRLQWLMNVDNLLNRKYYYGGFLAPKATVRTGIRWDF
ncbi:MAG: TonB-dependent receptor [Acidobacteria bacterium]|nr:TonB-dependent receptor [Acidobacteriota bacterium]